MIGSTVALLTRSLRVDARLLRHHVFRLLFVGIIYLALLSAQATSSFLGAPGLQLFSMMAGMNAVFITLAGLGFFASAITEEKEEETLGLLKMAGVRPLSLLLGKSTSRLVTAGLLLSAQFPFTLLAITLGGVTIDQVLAVYLSLLAYTALVANLALFWSVFCERTGTAAAGVFLVLLVYFAGPPLVAEFSTGIVNGQFWAWARPVAPACLAAAEWLTMSTSIITRLIEILSSRFSGSPLGVQVVSNFAAGACLFGLSWIGFDRFTQTRAAGPARRLLWKRPDVLRVLGAGRAWSQPLIWKDFHFVAGGRTMLLVKFVCYGLLVVLFAGLQIYWDRRLDLDDLAAATLIAMLIAGGIELSLLSGRVFQSEIRWETWPTLRMLPVSLPRIAYSKVAGCLLALGPALAWLTVGVLLDPSDTLEDIGDALTEWGFWFSLLLFAAFLHLTALLSLYVKWGALPLAIGIVFFCYMFLGMCAMILFSFNNFVPISRIDENLIAAFFLMFMLGVNVAFEAAIGLRLWQLTSR